MMLQVLYISNFRRQIMVKKVPLQIRRISATVCFAVLFIIIVSKISDIFVKENTVIQSIMIFISKNRILMFYFWGQVMC